MPIKVEIPPPLRDQTGGANILQGTGATVQTLLQNICEQHSGLGGKLFKDGKLQQFVNLFLNDEDIRYLDDLETAVKDGDTLSIIPRVAGG